jgi:hypothetical protein
MLWVLYHESIQDVNFLFFLDNIVDCPVFLNPQLKGAAMAKKSERLNYGLNPPFLDLSEAVDIVKRIYYDAGGSVSEDQLSSLIKNSVKSSSYRRKMQALKNYGLITQDGSNGRINISSLGRNIIAPTSPDDKYQAIKTAFLNIETFKTLYELWAGKILPVDEFLLNTIRERAGIPPELVKQWKNIFMSSGTAAGLFQQRQDGKTQVRIEAESLLNPNVDSGESLPQSPPQPAPPPHASPPSLPPSRLSSEFNRINIPLFEGRVAAIEIPFGSTGKDMEKFIRVIRVMFDIDDKD